MGLKKWVKRGKEINATHLLVVVDTFNYESYPVYVMPTENLIEKKMKYNINMQRIKEIIKL